MKRLLQIVAFLCLYNGVIAQDSTAVPYKKFSVHGYLKDLEVLTFGKSFKELVTGNIIHNRLNFKWKPSSRITTAAEFRTRLFWGEMVKNNPDFVEQLKNQHERIDMQKAVIINKSFVLHTNVERLYFDYYDSEINVRIGRQRINWGLANTWNPNDVFNSYNFLDFDYEERPGVDGGKMQYRFNSNFNAELAYAHTGKSGGNIAAIKYALNKWNYDMQLISGWYQDHITLGAGWAGRIKEAGFKGEVQYFFAKKGAVDHLNLSIETDYMFKNAWYVSTGMLFSSSGLSHPVSSWNEFNLAISPERLMPTKWNFIVTTMKEFTPLFTCNVSVVYAPGANLAIFFPTFTYNIATNFDCSFVWQSFFAEKDDKFEDLIHRCFFRVKWSF